MLLLVVIIHFQSDIDKTSDWCKMNKMKINTKKCKIMRTTRKKSPLAGEYNIEGQLWNVLICIKI